MSVIVQVLPGWRSQRISAWTSWLLKKLLLTSAAYGLIAFECVVVARRLKASFDSRREAVTTDQVDVGLARDKSAQSGAAEDSILGFRAAGVEAADRG